MERTLLICVFALKVASLSLGQAEDFEFLPSETSASATIGDEVSGQSFLQMRRANRPVVVRQMARNPHTSAIARATTRIFDSHGTNSNSVATASAVATANVVSTTNVVSRTSTGENGVTAVCCDACPTFSLPCREVCVECGAPSVASALGYAPSNAHTHTGEYTPTTYGVVTHGPVGSISAVGPFTTSVSHLHPGSYNTRPNDHHHPGSFNTRPYDHHHPGSFNTRPYGHREALFATRVCCADCPMGDLDCFSTCERENCHSVAKCVKAGEGAYSAFCMARCTSSLQGFSARSHTLDFLPDPACRGVCSANVQQLCQDDGCRQFGCIVSNCLSVAGSLCN